jgi:hypothetical protein
MKTAKTTKTPKTETRDARFAELDAQIAKAETAPKVTAPAIVSPAIVTVKVIRTPEEIAASRHNAALKAAQTKTPEQRSNAAKSAWITIRANRAAAALAAQTAVPQAA